MNLSIDTARVELTASSHSPHSWLFNMLVLCQVEYLEGVGPTPVETKSFRMSKKGIISWVVSIFELTSLIFSRPENKGLFFQNGLLSSIDNLFTGSVGVVDGGEGGGGLGWFERNWISKRGLPELRPEINFDPKLPIHPGLKFLKQFYFLKFKFVNG